MGSEEIVRSLARDLTPVRRLRGIEWRMLLWAGLALLFVSIGTWVLGTRPDLSGKIRDPAYLLENGLLLLVFALSAWNAFHLSIPGAERGAAARMLPILLLLAWVCLIAGHAPDAMTPTAARVSAWRCVLKMSCLALAPAVAVVLMLRKAAPLNPAWTSGFALLSAGSLAVLGTRFLCAKDTPLHVLLWHLGPLLAAALVGIQLGKWLLIRPGARA